MASIHLQGILRDSLGEIDVGAIITFTHMTTTGETIASTKRNLLIPPDGAYSIDVEYGQIRIDYTTRYTERFVSMVIVNQDSTATSLPELLNAAVPVTPAVILEMQGILADAVAASDTSEAFANQLTTFDLIGSVAIFAPDTNITTKGYLTSGDGGSGSWVQNGDTGQTPSQSPAQLGNALLNDGNGNQWAYVPTLGTAKKEVNPYSLGAVGDNVADDLLVLRACHAAGDIVSPDGQFRITEEITVLPNRTIKPISRRKVTIRLDTPNPSDNVFDGFGVSNTHISGLIIDGGYTATHTSGSGVRLGGSSSNCTVDDNYFINIPRDTVLVRDGCDNVKVRGNKFEIQNAGTAHIYFLTGNENCLASDNHFVDSVGGCIWLSGGNMNTDILRNRCDKSEFELIGVRLDNKYGNISGNRATGTGDNGISVTGDGYTVNHNVCYGNDFAGIALYGSKNTAQGNILYDNGIGGGSIHGGMLIAAQFGGLASENTVDGNAIFRQDGPESNQHYGIRVSNTSYTAWAAAQLVPVGRYRTNANNLYESETTGTAGSSPPVHTSGSASDGGVMWLYVGTFKNSNARPDMNRIGVNNIFNHTGGNIKEFGVTANSFEEPSEYKILIQTDVWSQGLDVLSGEYVHYYAGNVARHYKAKNGGSTGATPPTHTSGSFSDGNVTWLYIGETEWVQGSANDSERNIIKSSLQIECIDTVSEGNAPKIYAGTFFPEGQVGAPNGSLYLRNNATFGIQVYIKTGVNGSNTGWSTLAIRVGGTTGNRTVSPQPYQEYFDTSLGIPIWWSGSQWVNSSGSSV